MERHSGPLMKSAIILGAGGHSRVVISLLAASYDVEIIGILDLKDHVPGERIMTVPVIGSIHALEEWQRRDHISVYLAIGDNATRRDWFDKIKKMGFTLPNLVSRAAIVDPYARMGEGNIVCSRAFIGPGAVLGDNNLINTGAIVEHEVHVGSHCHLGPSSTVSGRTSIGNDTFVGVGATIIDRVHIAAETTVGAGATVVRSIEQTGGTFIGTPARRLR